MKMVSEGEPGGRSRFFPATSYVKVPSSFIGGTGRGAALPGPAARAARAAAIHASAGAFDLWRRSTRPRSPWLRRDLPRTPRPCDRRTIRVAAAAPPRARVASAAPPRRMIRAILASRGRSAPRPRDIDGRSASQPRRRRELASHPRRRRDRRSPPPADDPRRAVSTARAAQNGPVPLCIAWSS